MERISHQNIGSGDKEEAPNFHQVSEERKELKRALRELGIKTGGEKPVTKSPQKEIFEKHYKEPLEELDRKTADFKISNFDNLTDAKEFLKKQKTEYELEIAANHTGVDYDSIIGKTPEIGEVKTALDNVAGLKEFRMRRMLEILNPKTSKSAVKRNEEILKTIREDITYIEEKLDKTDPIVLRQTELAENKEELGRSGHICITKCTEKNLETIGDGMLIGKPMFLHGPTGTGKTSIARYAAKHFTGYDPEMVFCNPQTKESNVWGKTGIRPVEGGAIETVEIYGPLARAMAEGKVVIFDEFTALPKEQMVFIKGVFNAKVGDKINIVGNGVVEIQPGFQMIFTANLKSEKNPERQDLPPEIAREFEQNNIEIKYTPPEEAYDIMLTRLMNRDGSLDMSFYDLNTTLPNLCKVMSEMQESYTNRTDKEVARRAGVLGTSNEVASLKKFVMTQGSVEAILSAWLVEKQTGENERTFAEFLDERFKTALTFKEYSKEDRILVAKILASKGFLLTLTPKDLDLSEDIFKLNIIKQMRGKEAVEELKKESRNIKHLTLKEVAELDPFNKRAEIMTNKAEALLGRKNVGDEFLSDLNKKTNKLFGGEDKESTDDPAQMNTFLLSTYKGWGVAQTTLDTLKFSPEFAEPRDLNYTQKKGNIDPSKFGEYTLNPDTDALDYDTIPENKIKVITLDESFTGKKLDEIGNHILKTYPNAKLPGLEYYKYILKNPSKAPQSLKDGNYHFFFGSLFRNSRGSWLVPCVRWVGSSFHRRGYWLGRDWSSYYRVVIIET